MRVDAFDFELPAERIAQHPASPRDSARLLRIGAGLSDHLVRDLPDLLRPGDLLVFNDTRVLPTRFAATRDGASVEVTLIEPDGGTAWWCLARPGRKLRDGDPVELAPGLAARVGAKRADGAIRLAFDMPESVLVERIKAAGAMPLPPYIKRRDGFDAADRDAYQTMFARHDGAVAAPTASLHLTQDLLDRLLRRGLRHAFVTLHVGAGTFAPVKVEDTEQHVMHAERFDLPAETASAIAATRRAGSRVVAVGTTVLRTLEACAGPDGSVRPGSGATDLFCVPGYRFKVVDLMLTNFHLPRSTLFMLVCAFGGTERLRSAYAHAIATGYRFYSYGDATLIDRNEAP